MERTYYDIGRPGSLTGIAGLIRYAGQRRDKVRDFLSAQPAYTMHRPVRRKFPRRKTFSKGIGDLYQADLMDLTSLANFNDSHRYVLVAIDVFSRYAFAVPLKTKGAVEVTKAFETGVLDVRPCRLLQTDKGTEFVNDKFQTMLRNRGVHWYSSENPDTKAALAERLIRTIKERLFRYMTYKNTNRYIDVLGDVVRAYNDSWHRSIGMAPSEVGPHNEKEIAGRLYPPKPTSTPSWKLNVGDPVRISIERQVFRKGYAGSWSEEIFTVFERHPTFPVTYGIRDANGEPIKGKFYEMELQKVTPPEFYKVEKILKTRRIGGRVRYFVKFQGYPDSMNSWIDDLRKL